MGGPHTIFGMLPGELALGNPCPTNTGENLLHADVDKLLNK